MGEVCGKTLLVSHEIPVSLGGFLGDISSLKSEVQISYDQR